MKFDKQFDVLIAGAGASGCALAAKLADARPDWKIALIEAGPRKPNLIVRMPLGIAFTVAEPNDYNYAYETTPQPGLNGRRGYQPRGRGVGGSSLINAMCAIRGRPSDFDGWANDGCPGWSWDDLLPVFKRIETNSRGASELHGDQGPLHVSDLQAPNPVTRLLIQAMVEAGINENPDFNGPTQEGCGIYQVYQKNGRRHDVGTAYLSKKRRNLTILSETRVNRVLTENGRAIGLTVRQGDKEKNLGAREEVILAGGAFGSPQLLLLSGIGPADELKAHGISVVADRPSVGKNLHDHLDHITPVIGKLPGTLGGKLKTLIQMALASPQYFLSGDGPLTSNSAEAGAFIKSRPDLAEPDLQLHSAIAIVDDHGRKIYDKQGVSLHVCGLDPKSRGQVTLASADPKDAPLIDPAYLAVEEDLDTLVRGTRICQQIMMSPSFQKYKFTPAYEPFDAPDHVLRDQIRDRADTIYHPVGTCRMGSDPDAVVTPRLTVNGIERLRVVDASVMPKVVSGNTEWASVVIGEKAADMIVEDHRTA